jgi:HlyD family secretion protein
MEEIGTMSSAPSSPPLRARDGDAATVARQGRHRLARIVRQGGLALFAVLAIAGVALALRPRPVPVDVVRAARGPLAVVVEESGVTRVKDRFVMSAPVTGNLSRVFLDPGDAVKEGDTLAEIAPAAPPLLDERSRSEAEARLGAALSSLGQASAQEARARAARELSQQDLDRTKSLAASGSLARESLERAEFQDRMHDDELASAVFARKVAAEEVRIARAALANDVDRKSRRHIDVIAPVSGAVLRVHQRSAGVVASGAPLLEVGDTTALEVVVDLLTTDAVHVAVGTPVVLQGWGGDRPLAGRVRQIEPSGFTRPSALGVDEQRVNIVIAFTEPRERWADLGDGYRVEARLTLWQSNDVLKLPQGALFRHGDGWAVYRVDGNVARLTSVQIGHRGESEVEIVSGLEMGAEVAVHPGDRVKEGARVAPQ